jgi:hypothetical protein
MGNHDAVQILEVDLQGVSVLHQGGPDLTFAVEPAIEK